MRLEEKPEHFIADRIVASPNVVHGKPRIAGTRIMVYQILDLLAQGRSMDEIITEDYPTITKEDILACIMYASDMVREERVFSVP